MHVIERSPILKFSHICNPFLVWMLCRKFSIKNISEQRLNIEAKDLTERFIRGDISRSTEGSGLGLSIAKNLTELQGGKFYVYLDGDLFRVTITFQKLEALPEDMSINLLEEQIEASLDESLKEETTE